MERIIAIIMFIFSLLNQCGQPNFSQTSEEPKEKIKPVSEEEAHPETKETNALYQQWIESDEYKAIRSKLPEKYWKAAVWLRYGISELDGITVEDMFLAGPMFVRETDDGPGTTEFGDIEEGLKRFTIELLLYVKGDLTLSLKYFFEPIAYGDGYTALLEKVIGINHKTDATETLYDFEERAFAVVLAVGVQGFEGETAEQ